MAKMTAEAAASLRKSLKIFHKSTQFFEGRQVYVCNSHKGVVKQLLKFG